MNDLIERLLAGPQPDRHSGVIMEEAADEIERLRQCLQYEQHRAEREPVAWFCEDESSLSFAEMRGCSCAPLFLHPPKPDTDSELETLRKERDELKTWLEDQVCEAKDFAYKLENKTTQLTRYRAVMEMAVDAIEYLIDRSNDSDEMAYGTLTTTFVRDCLQSNLIALREALRGE